MILSSITLFSLSSCFNWSAFLSNSYIPLLISFVFSSLNCLAITICSYTSFSVKNYFIFLLIWLIFYLLIYSSFYITVFLIISLIIIYISCFLLSYLSFFLFIPSELGIIIGRIIFGFSFNFSKSTFFFPFNPILYPFRSSLFF